MMSSYEYIPEIRKTILFPVEVWQEIILSAAQERRLPKEQVLILLERQLAQKTATPAPAKEDE